MEGNPFQFATPLAHPDELVGRDDDLGRLLSLATSGTYTLLEAPRRYGKTSLLKAAAERWREAGGLAVWVDLSGVLTAAEAARRFEQALSHTDHGRLQETLTDLLRSVRLRAGPVEIGGLPGRPRPGDDERLHALLEVAAEAARSAAQRSLVCLDEFQDVLAVPGLDGTLRSHLQHQADDVSYVFSGSEPSLLRELFSERGRPLFAQAKPLRLARIDLALLAEYVVGRFRAEGVEASEAAEWLTTRAAGHPQRTILLAWHLWDRADGLRTLGVGDAEDALGAALLDAEPQLDAVWRALAQNERRVAVAVALGVAPMSREAGARTGVASASAAQRALQRLVEKGVVERAGSDPRLTDPLLALHLAARHEG